MHFFLLWYHHAAPNTVSVDLGSKYSNCWFPFVLQPPNQLDTKFSCYFLCNISQIHFFLFWPPIWSATVLRDTVKCLSLFLCVSFAHILPNLAYLHTIGYRSSGILSSQNIGHNFPELLIWNYSSLIAYETFKHFFF